jgi:uncharacterized protein YbjT (DUF2867 family)
VKRPHFSPALASFELAWTDAAFDAIYPEPPRSVLPHGIASMHPARFFQGVLASVPLEQSLGLRVTLWMIALAPIFTIRRLGTIASIDPDDRVRVLERLLTSPYYFVRQLAMSFKAIATLLYAQSERVRSAMTTPIKPLVSATSITSRAKAKSDGSSESRGSHDHAAE